MMDPELEKALQTFLGGGTGRVFTADNGAKHQLEAPVAILTGSSTGQLVARLRSEGFTRFKEFALRPLGRPSRLIIPLGNSTCTINGLNMYVPYTIRGRALKTMLSAIMGLAWTGWARQKIIVASRKPLPIESLVSEITGEPQPVFALSLGVPTRFRKLTIQVMRVDGEVLGYLKFPMTPEAVVRVRREAAMIKHLSRFSILEAHVPRLLFAGQCEQGYFLFHSGRSPSPASFKFGSYHQEFLANLWSIESIEKPGEALVEEVGEQWRKSERQLDSEWRELGKAALITAHQELRKLRVRCGIMHGDFQPCNTSIRDGRLFVFDWESSEFQVPHQWDIFYFHELVSSQLKRRNPQQFPLDRNSGERGLYLLYLLFYVHRKLLEGIPVDLGAQSRRRRLLTKALST